MYTRVGDYINLINNLEARARIRSYIDKAMVELEKSGADIGKIRLAQDNHNSLITKNLPILNIRTLYVPYSTKKGEVEKAKIEAVMIVVGHELCHAAYKGLDNNSLKDNSELGSVVKHIFQECACDMCGVNLYKKLRGTPYIQSVAFVEEMYNGIEYTSNPAMTLRAGYLPSGHRVTITGICWW